MTRQAAVQRLFSLWAIASLCLACAITVQSFAGKYGEDWAAAWNWLLAIAVPSLAILGVAAFVDSTATWKKAAANRFKYRVAWWGSFFVLGCSTAVLAVEPLLPISAFELFNISGVALTLAQGIVLGAIGSVVFDRR